MTSLVMYTNGCIRTSVKRPAGLRDGATASWEKVRIVTDTNVSDLSTEDLSLVSQGFETAPASSVIRWALETYGDSVVLAASFEDIVLIDLVTRIAPGTEVVFLDTEAHFPETLEFVEQVRARYGLNLTVTRPGPEAAAHPCGTEQCCQFRKVEPLRRRPRRQAGLAHLAQAIRRTDACRYTDRQLGRHVRPGQGKPVGHMDRY